MLIRLGQWLLIAEKDRHNCYALEVVKAAFPAPSTLVSSSAPGVKITLGPYSVWKKEAHGCGLGRIWIDWSSKTKEKNNA